MRYIIVCIIGYMTVSVGYPQSGLPGNNQAAAAVLAGRILDKSFFSDSLGVTFWTNYICGATKGGAEEFNVGIGKSGKFTIQLPYFTHPARARVYNRKNGVIFLDWQLVEPGDNVRMVIKISNSMPVMHFSGKGAEKYSAWNHINPGIRAGFRFSPQPRQTKVILDSVIKSRRNEIEKFHLPKQIHNVLSFDIMFEAYARMCRFVYSLDSTAQQKWAGCFLRSLASEVDTTQLVSKMLSRYFVEYVFELNVVDLYLSQDRVHSFDRLFQRISENYTGTLRDKLLLYLFSDPTVLANFGGIDERVFFCSLRDSYYSAKTDWIRRAILQKILTVAKGADVYPFALPDSNGKLISLHLLKGKVVLIDIWGNPCTGCLLFKKSFEKEVLPEISKPADLVVLSVNIDREKDRWLEGINTYSRPDYLNVYTGGLGSGHPLLTFYDVMGVPSFLLIDKHGRLVSSTIPLPHFKKSKQLIELLNRELNN